MRQHAEVMVVEVKELGLEGLNVVVYDTRTDDEATFTAAISGSSSDGTPEWRKQAPDELDTSHLVQYINHEWHNAAVEYTEDGLIKNGSQMERVHDHILVQELDSLTARIERVSGSYIVTVEADAITKFEMTFTDSELGLETHPALRD